MGELLDVIQEASDEVLEMLDEEKVGQALRKVIRECSLRKATYSLDLTNGQRHMMGCTFRNIQTSMRGLSPCG